MDGGQGIAERISGSGSFYDKTDFEMDAVGNTINYSQDAEFEYFPRAIRRAPSIRSGLTSSL